MYHAQVPTYVYIPFRGKYATTCARAAALSLFYRHVCPTASRPFFTGRIGDELIRILTRTCRMRSVIARDVWCVRGVYLYIPAREWVCDDGERERERERWAI